MEAFMTVLAPVQLGEDFTQDSHAAYRRLRHQGAARPVVLPDGWPGWLITSYADARRLLADPRLGRDATEAARLLPPGSLGRYASPLMAHMLNTDPPDHTRLRRFVNKAFTARTVQGLRPRIERASAGLLGGLADGAAADLVADYALPLPITVICELLGVPAADRDDFRDWTLAIVVAASSPDELAAASSALTAYLTALIDAKRVSPAGDLLSQLILVSEEGDGRLTATELLSMAFLLLAAGFETTVNLIANGVLALLRHPDQLALLRAEPTLLPKAVEELLRYDGPVHLALGRFTTEPVDVAGTRIPVDQFVHVSLLAANRDGGHFPDPDRLDITREPAGHLAFGHGIHHCVGAPLARMEGQIAIGQLLRRFPGITLAADPEALRWHQSTLIHGLRSLPVHLGPKAGNPLPVA
jgi:cytochrome P450